MAGLFYRITKNLFGPLLILIDFLFGGSFSWQYHCDIQDAVAQRFRFGFEHVGRKSSTLTRTVWQTRFVCKASRESVFNDFTRPVRLKIIL